MLLALFGFAGYWYGHSGVTKTNIESTNTNVTANETTTGQAQDSAKEASIVGTVKQVLGDSIELSTGTGETTKTVTAIISNSTSLRKLDYRNVPKQGLGDGVVISKSDLKTGATVVIRTKDTSTTRVQASKVSLLIYR